MKKGNQLRNKWAIFKANNSTAHICVLIIVVNLIFILASSLLISILPENRGHSIGEILRLAFTLMVNPSGKYIYSEAPISLIVTTIVVLLGMISLTGGTVGFITSVINGFLEKTARNKRELKLEDHIVILNYNQCVPATLLDYCYDDMDSTYIVILTTEDKDAVNQKIDEMYNLLGMKKRFKNVIVRTGNPMSRLDLDRISLSKARTVLLMTPGSVGEADTSSIEERGFSVSKLFLFVTGYLDAAKSAGNVELIVETSGENMDRMVREYHLSENAGKAIGVEYNKIIGKILGITTLMPPVNDVMRQLFSFEGIEIYTREKPSCSILEELQQNRSVMPLFDKGDIRVYAAENEEEFEKKSAKPYQLSKALPGKKIVPNFTFEKSEIVIVGTNAKLPHVLESISCYKRDYNNSELHVILADSAEKQEELQKYYRDPKYADILLPETYAPVIVKDLYRPMNELSKIVNNSADTLLFLSDDGIDASHIDEKPLLYWSDIRNKIDDKAHADIIVEIRDPENESIIRQKNSDQILVSNDFLGRLYAQLGKNPMRLEVIMDIITSNGDPASVDAANKHTGAGDMLSIKVETLFGGIKDLTFSSKRELILWTLNATGGAIMPIGLVRGGVPYMFPRTDNDNDGLDSCVLLGINDGQVCPGASDKIKLEADDELVIFITGNK